MIILGIDPGQRGALAVLDTEAHRVNCHDMPGTTAELHDLVAGLPEIRICMLEKPFYPQSIGTANAGKIGEAFGALKGALAWRSIPTELVAPAKWKKALQLGSNKDASRERAMQLFPDDADQFRLKKDDGRAEAALLAWHGRDRAR